MTEKTRGTAMLLAAYAAVAGLAACAPRTVTKTVTETVEKVVYRDRVYKSQELVKPILFDFDKATPRADQAPAIEWVVAYMAANPQAKVLLQGQTDTAGESDYNLLLGLKRAREVAHILIEMEADDWRIDVKTIGENGSADLDPAAARRVRVFASVPEDSK